jgi:hypothetical protein
MLKAKLFASTFLNVKFSYAEFYGANLTEANFKGTDKKLLYMADLQKCNLENAKIQGFYLESVKLNAASLKGTIFKDMEFQNVEWGDFSELNINVSNAAYFKNYYRDKGLFDLSDQFYIKQIQCFLGQKSISSYKKFLYKLWWYSSKFGTSFLNWIIVSLGISTIFGMIFSIFPSLFNEFNTPFSPFYFSIVTFTTLGFGDIKPITLGGEILVAIEVFIGYIMLGGLITIFASKFIRR